MQKLFQPAILAPDASLPTRGRLLTRIFPIIAVALFSQGCTSLKTLQPALESNEQNVKELVANAKADAALIPEIGDAIFEQEIISRRSRVAQELATIGLKLQSQDVAAWAASGQDEQAKELRALQQSWAGASADAKKITEKKYPVLVAVAQLDVSLDQVERDAKWIVQNGKENPVITQDSLKKYPYVKVMIENQQKFRKAMAARLAAVDQQGSLANAHAALFVYAAKVGANNREVLASILGDAELRTQALGLVQNDKVKSSIGEGLDLLMGLIKSAPEQ